MSSTEPTDRAALEREIKHRQDSLATTVDELTARVAPKALAQRGAATAQAKVAGLVLDEDGAVRFERVAAAGGALLALVGALVWRKRR